MTKKAEMPRVVFLDGEVAIWLWRSDEQMSNTGDGVLGGFQHWDKTSRSHRGIGCPYESDHRLERWNMRTYRLWGEWAD